jgi:uncharacterized membrane protein
MSRLLAGALAAATVAYPCAVYLGLGHVEPRWMALALAALALARAWAARRAFWLAAAAGAGLLSVAALLGNALLPLKLYPVLVNAALLAVFGLSLWRPPCAIERLARLSEPDLPPAAVAYTRKVTRVWCGFFAANGAAALGTALWASTEAWAVYNGVVAYLLMGSLFAFEWLVRQRVKARTRAAHG